MAVVAWAEGIGKEGGRYLSDWCWVGRRRPMPCKKGGEGGFNLLREEEEDVGILGRYLKEGPMMTWASLARSGYVRTWGVRLVSSFHCIHKAISSHSLVLNSGKNTSFVCCRKEKSMMGANN